MRAVCAKWFCRLKVLFESSFNVIDARHVHGTSIRSITKCDVDFRKLCGYAVLR